MPLEAEEHEMETITKSVIYKEYRLHARAVPHAGSTGFNAEVLVRRLGDDDPEDHVVQIRPWLHGSADRALRYGLSHGRDWIEVNAATTRHHPKANKVRAASRDAGKPTGT